MSGEAFEVATGDGLAPPAEGVERRAAEVRVAFEGLLQIRRLGPAPGTGDPMAVPAAWERNRPVRSVALALEAAGVAPSAVDGSGRRVATGYRVSPGERPGSVRVEWLGPPGGGAAHDEEDALSACARTLERLGWEALLYRGPRRRRFLEVEPVAGVE
ncbi:hypothetical protein [Streptomyces sp. SP18CS02]|uniref:hypothetical protein n=1 Tax=Streptomyces sp. SP18CS02 TaxID=3002531 RepID=UPI002E771C32|nr:hypothetical protein [Streptomyces sp. SP18CS02]MEE1752977.1 hypothetical protein [Streptomyces sp. SP18CS02]